MSDKFRDLKATMPADEFGAIQWAAKRAGAGHKAMPLDEFLRETLRERVRAVVRAEIARGKSIPPDIAHLLSDTVAGAKAFLEDPRFK
jgi:hypothetical protein